MKKYLLVSILLLCTYGCNNHNDGTPLDKYLKFKEMYSTLKTKRSDLKILDGKIVALHVKYMKVSKEEWLPGDIQLLDECISERDALKINYSYLAQEYNEETYRDEATLKYRFRESLPKGGTEILPRFVQVFPDENDQPQ